MADIFSGDFGILKLTCGIDRGRIVSISFGEGEESEEPAPENALLWDRARRELTEYFGGERREFDLPLSVGGTEFQRLVWGELQKIPYGQTRSYGQIARMIGRPKAARAVGMACHDNPIVVVIPCHRVLGADGSLTGFGGGLAAKERLLELEGVKK